MPNKSKRNRRPVSSNQVAKTAVNNTTVENKPAYKAPVKQATLESFVTTANFVRDLKWSGLVALIIAVLIIVALIVVPH